MRRSVVLMIMFSYVFDIVVHILCCIDWECVTEQIQKWSVIFNHSQSKIMCVTQAHGFQGKIHILMDPTIFV